MDTLTERKKRALINDCEVEKLKYTWKNRTAVKQYDFLIALLEGVKASLDYIMGGIE